jgi:hypothetical protein
MDRVYNRSPHLGGSDREVLEEEIARIRKIVISYSMRALECYEFVYRAHM